MSHYLPVFFFLVDEGELPRELNGWLSVQGLIGDRSENRAGAEFHYSVSRNWWHQQALMEIAEALKVEGLAFVQSELACLRADELRAASASLEHVINEAQQGLPQARQVVKDHGPLWWVIHDLDSNYKTYEVPIEEVRRAFEAAEVVFKASASVDGGYEATVAFFSFIKSLHATTQAALVRNKCLLYVQPQP